MIKGRKLIVSTVICFLILGFLYRFTPRRIEFLGHYDKVFAHRVNSLEKQKQALKYFNGIELDLTYTKENDKLEVCHSISESINLTFENYLNQISVNNFPFLWLDIKKLDQNNADAIVNKLNTLFDSRNYPKNKILVETQQPEALVKFTQYGYKTSYYLNSNLHTLSNTSLTNEIIKINKTLKLQPKIGLSTGAENYEILRTNFPKKTKYIWALSSPYRIKYFEFGPILKDETVAIVLTSFKSFTGNL